MFISISKYQNFDIKPWPSFSRDPFAGVYITLNINEKLGKTLKMKGRKLHKNLKKLQLSGYTLTYKVGRWLG